MDYPNGWMISFNSFMYMLERIDPYMVGAIHDVDISSPIIPIWNQSQRKEMNQHNTLPSILSPLIQKYFIVYDIKPAEQSNRQRQLSDSFNDGRNFQSNQQYILFFFLKLSLSNLTMVTNLKFFSITSHQVFLERTKLRKQHFIE